MLGRSAILIVIVFIASTCSIWQENVRPKLYVELGKLLFSIFLCTIHSVYGRTEYQIEKYGKKEKENEIMCCEIWISFDFIRLENNATSYRIFPYTYLLRYLFISNFSTKKKIDANKQ